MACGCVNYLVCRLSSSYYKHGTVQVLCYPSLLLRYSALVRFGLVKKHTTNLCSLPQGKQASRQASNVTSTCASCCCCHCHYTQTWVSPPLAGCLGPQLATGLSSTIHLFASLHSRMRPSYIRPSKQTNYACMLPGEMMGGTTVVGVQSSKNLKETQKGGKITPAKNAHQKSQRWSSFVIISNYSPCIIYSWHATLQPAPRRASSSRETRRVSAAACTPRTRMLDSAHWVQCERAPGCGPADGGSRIHRWSWDGRLGGWG
ncbi:uncharacterized protein IWZ02DRAFT_279746 [Phyllosticta citriasiana]|uniref:uncharacterized protein n=1 Tax=Phyllosticta citriasiana TaxID=595635 RepID=UPI0030FD717B